MIDLIRLHLSDFFCFLGYEGNKTCQECVEWNLDQEEVRRHKKFTYCHCQTWK